MSNSVSSSKSISNLNQTASGNSATGTKTTGLGFGSKTGTGLFGNKNAQAAPKPVNPLIQRINELKAAYDTSSPNCRFVQIVYDALSKSPNLNLAADVVNLAKQSNPDPKLYQPAVIAGFEGIVARQNSQKEIINHMKNKLYTMQEKIINLNKDFKELLASRIQSITEKNNEIQTMLMSVLEKSEVKALSGFQLSREEQELLDELQKIQEEVDKPNQYVAALNTLSLKAKLVKDSLIVPPTYNLDAATIQKAETILRASNMGISSMIKHTKTIDKQIKYIEAALAERDGVVVEKTDSDEE